MCYSYAYIFNPHPDRSGILPVDRCIDEIRLAKRQRPIRCVIFKDDRFLSHEREWIEAFSNEYKREVGLPFIISIAPQTLDRIKLMLLKDAGLIIVLVDIISGSERVIANLLQRRISHSYLILSSQILYDSNVIVMYGLAIDNPFETEDDRIETITVMTNLKKPFLIRTLPFASVSKDILSSERKMDAGPKSNDYHKRLLSITPYIPRSIIRFLNKPEIDRNVIHTLLLNVLCLITGLFIKPLSVISMVARSSYLNPSRAIITFFLILNRKRMFKPLLD
ncbi:MAG: hypothetical protein Fur0020_02530 [Thermodesulfovibrionia bacterium]